MAIFRVGPLSNQLELCIKAKEKKNTSFKWNATYLKDTNLVSQI